MNIDLVMVVFYLLITLVVGYKYGKGVSTLQDYALGGRSFNTATLAATLIATFLSGSWFVVAMNNSYQDGLLFFLCDSANAINMLITAFILVPRMGEFLGKISLPQAMGELYGEKVRVITSISGILVCIGFTAMQFKILSSLLSYFGGINSDISVVISSAIVIAYCIFGGVRAVVFTDVLQFVTFMLGIIPIFMAVWAAVDFQSHPESVEKFWDLALSFKSNTGTDYSTDLLYSLIPGMGLATFQRISMAKDTIQLSKAFSIASVFIVLFLLIPSLIGIMLFVYDPNLGTQSLLGILLEKFSTPGLKGVMVISVVAMSMSTLDSHLNSASVTFSHDLCSRFKFGSSDEQRLKLSRYFLLISGGIATIIAIKFQNLIQIVFFAVSFYNPVVTPILLLTILGFRPQSSLPALVGMGAGFTVYLYWRIMIQPGTGIEPLIPAMLSNIFFFIGLHYLLGLPGGWVGPKDMAPLELARANVKKRWSQIKDLFIGFIRSLFWRSGNYLKIDTSLGMQLSLGVLVIASYFTVTISNPDITVSSALYLLQIASCVIAALLITAPLWSFLISVEFRATIVLYSLIYLIYSNAILMFYYQFSSTSIVSLLVNILACSFFCGTFMTILITCLAGVIGVAQYALSGHEFIFAGADILLLGCYGSFALAFVLLPFLSRKQGQIDILSASEEKFRRLADTLKSQVALREENIKKSISIDKDILRNINHEVRTPMNNTRLSVDFFVENWNKPKFQKHAEETLAGLKSNMDRLYKYVSNMLDLSEYQANRMLFDIKRRNFKALLEGIIKPHDNILFKYASDVPEEIDFDEVKMTELFEEIIANANDVIGRNKKGDEEIIIGGYRHLTEAEKNDIIEITVTRDQSITLNNQSWERIKILIKDRGVGIPKDEMNSIFRPFYVSSRTKSAAGGRGLGLALVHEIVRGHLGEVFAEGDDDGATIGIIMPIVHPTPDFLASNAHVETDIPEIDLRKIVENYAHLESKFDGRIPKVLMIEDEHVVREMGGLMVMSLGYEFVGIGNGDDAVKYIMSQEFDADIILLDMMLPDYNGFEIMKRVHKKLQSLGVPVVIQSGLSAGDDLIEGTLQLGAKCLINKPYSRKGFQDMIKKYLGLE
jgi:Na+/proline symporter/signal transduction histidine kinase/CheY-like chemotaxis protein